MVNRGGLLGAALIGAGGVWCTSPDTLFCEPFNIPVALPLPLFAEGGTGALSDDAELL